MDDVSTLLTLIVVAKNSYPILDFLGTLSQLQSVAYNVTVMNLHFRS